MRPQPEEKLSRAFWDDNIDKDGSHDDMDSGKIYWSASTGTTKPTF
jgi:hypothetical protein